MNASFQSEIQKCPAKGVAGDKASLNPIIYTDRNYLAGDGKVAVGNFVWNDPTNSTSGDYHGSGIFKALSSGTGQPLGLVERSQSYVNYNILDGGTLIVPENAALNVARRGDYYVVAATVATAGQKVFATLASGVVRTGTAGATIAGAVETNWTVTEGGAIGDIITISNWNA